MSSHRARILIADDHILIAELCGKLLKDEFDVIGIVGDGRSLVREAGSLKPDLVLVDVAMPILNGLDAGEKVKKDWPAIKLVYLTVSRDSNVAVEAFRRGASGYLLKTCASSELLIAVRQVLRGWTYMSHSLAKNEINFLRRQNKDTFKGRRAAHRAAARSLAVARRRQTDEGSGGHPEYDNPDSRLSQVSDYGGVRRNEHC
jgi:DNA-binding NarL/FixJ family response regulator